MIWKYRTFKNLKSCLGVLVLWELELYFVEFNSERVVSVAESPTSVMISDFLAHRKSSFRKGPHDKSWPATFIVGAA